MKGKEEMIKFSDHKFSEDIFIRSVESASYLIKYYIRTNDQIVLMTKEDLKTKFLDKIKKQQLKAPKIMTIDIETKVVDGVHIPYLFSIYDGKNTFSSFVDFAKDGPTELFNYILRSKYKGYTIYAHNLSLFDIVFLLNYLNLKKSGYILYN